MVHTCHAVSGLTVVRLHARCHCHRTNGDFILVGEYERLNRGRYDKLQPTGMALSHREAMVASVVVEQWPDHSMNDILTC